ncbi:MAG: DUF4956 domain-containing protein [Planctomycetota bacterium]
MPTGLTPQQMSFTFGQIALSLCLSFALAYLAAGVYRKMCAGPGHSLSFFITLIVTPMVVCMIMMAIGSNVALSLGLVGALSIIRFRTVIKDNRDMAFLFLTIGIGLCCGSGGYGIGLIGTVFVCGILLAIHAVGKTRLVASEYLLVFRQRHSDSNEASQLLHGLVSWYRLHGAADLGEHEGCEFTYRVRLGSSVAPETLLAKLRSTTGLSHSVLISPESQLAI